MKYIKLFENFEDYDPYELMITPPNKKAEMIVIELEKGDKANLNLVRDLITLGANLDWQDNFGSTALHDCARSNRLEIARMLIDAGADVNIQNNHGYTPLHYCTYPNDSIELTQMLIDAGADKTIPNNNRKLPYDYADTQELKKLLQP